jgi:hypothetical protein
MFRYQNSAGADRKKAFSDLSDLMFRNYQVPAFTWHVMVRKPEFAPSLQRERKDLWRGVSARPQQAVPDWAALITAGLKANRQLAFQTKIYSNQLVAPNSSDAPSETIPAVNFRLSKRQRLYWLPSKIGEALPLRISGGWRSIGEKLPIIVTLYSAENPLAGEEGVDLAEDRGQAPADNQWHDIALTPKTEGLHILEINDGFNETEVGWPAGTRIVASSGTEDWTYLRGTYRAFFLVPAGVDCLGGYAETRTGVIRGEDGQVVYRFGQLKGADYFDVRITPSDRPRIFALEGITGKRLLMTVPSFLSRSPGELLVPKETLGK